MRTRRRPRIQPIPLQRIESRLFTLRGYKVLLDRDLADIYGASTRRLNEQVRRNLRRFPSDFAFRMSRSEGANLKSQIATSSWGGKRKRPFVFTEQGAVMLASVLSSPLAVRAGIQVVRAFIRLRGILAAHEKLSRKLDLLERRYDRRFKVVFDAIRQLMDPPDAPPTGRIGFHRP